MGDGLQRELLAVLEETLALAPDERLAFLARRCGKNIVLRRDVEHLLVAQLDDDAEDFMEAPAFSFDANVGRTIDAYELVRRLDRGGMGAVYLARRRHPTRKVALKLIQQDVEDDTILRRFLNEREILAQLVHPQIATLHDGGTTEDGEPYFVMEYIEGEPIDRYCDTRSLTLDERLCLFGKVCSAVHFAHQHLVVHRDLKPENILVTPDGEPKLLDFGIAKLLDDTFARTAVTEGGRAPMTRLYASPEQIRGDAIQTTSDVYSLGVVLFKMLTGTYPYLFESGIELEHAICKGEPRRPTETRRDGGEALRVSTDVEAIVLKALRKEPAERYGSVGEMAYDVRHCLEGLPVRARQGDAVYQAGKLFRRHKLALGVGAGLLTLVVGFGGVSTYLWRRAEQERVQAEIERKRSDEMVGFLKRLFHDADPDVARGIDLTAREMLGRGRERLTGVSDSEVRIELLGTLGEIYYKLGEFDAAHEVMAELLELALRHYTEDSRELAKRIANFGAVVFNRGDYANAEGFFREALAMHRRLRLDASYDFRMQDNLASSLMLQGFHAKAGKIYFEVYGERLRRYGPGDKDVGTSLRSLGALEYARGEAEKAEEWLRQALEVRRKELGGKHTAVASVLDLLGSAVAEQGRREEAEKLYREALVIRQERLDADHPRVAQTKKNLAALRASEEPVVSERVAREALTALQRAKPGTWEVADAKSVLGACLVVLGRLEEAEPLLREGYEELLRIRGEEAIYTRLALQRLEGLD